MIKEITIIASKDFVLTKSLTLKNNNFSLLQVSYIVKNLQ